MHFEVIGEIEGIEAIALTTNGTLLPRFASELREAGLPRVNMGTVSRTHS